MKLASLFCSQECPEIEYLRFSVIYGRSGFVNCVTIGEIRNNLGADTLDSFDVFLSDLPGDIRPNLNVPFFQFTGDSNQSSRDLSKQGALNGKFKRQERLERVHDGEYSGILTVKAKPVSLKAPLSPR